MTKGTISVEVKCANCGTTTLDVPDDTSNDPVIHCVNGHVVGPYSSLKAALERQAHTYISAAFTDVTFKPTK